MREWRVRSFESLARHPIFDLQRQQLQAGADHREALVLDAPDWVNVVPLLDGDQVLLVRQWRFGIQAPTLEIPGGMVDPGEDAAGAAARELLEETGHRAGELRRLGTTLPNPAFLTNRLSSWVATDLEPVDVERELHGVDGEEIRVETVSLEDVPGMIATGEISHSLVVAAFYLLDRQAL